MRCYICGMDYEQTVYGGYAQVCLCTDRVTMAAEEEREEEDYDYERRFGA